MNSKPKLWRVNFSVPDKSLEYYLKQLMYLGMNQKKNITACIKTSNCSFSCIYL